MIVHVPPPSCVLTNSAAILNDTRKLGFDLCIPVGIFGQGANNTETIPPSVKIGRKKRFMLTKTARAIEDLLKETAVILLAPELSS